MKNIIVVLSGLLIGYLEATAEPPTEVADPGSPATEVADPRSPASARSRTTSSSSVSGPQKTKPIYIIHKWDFYGTFIDDFKQRVKKSKTTKTNKLENELKEELFDVLKSATLSDPSFSIEIKDRIVFTRYTSGQNEIIAWIDQFQADRQKKLAKYTFNITTLFDGYASKDKDEAASNASIRCFIDLLDSASDNLDLGDIENAVQEVFSLKKNTNAQDDTRESHTTDLLTTECYELFSDFLESYRFPTPSRSRTGSFL